MAQIREPHDFDAVAEVIRRRGLTALYEQVLNVLRAVPIMVLKATNANGAAHFRELIDAGFASVGGWTKTQVGGVDWVREISLRAEDESAVAALGIEVQISGRSTMLYRDVSHLRQSLVRAKIDAGLIVVPDDELAKYLTDRCPSLKEALETIHDVRADTVPIRVLPIGLDGFADAATPKRRTNLGRREP